MGRCKHLAFLIPFFLHWTLSGGQVEVASGLSDRNPIIIYDSAVLNNFTLYNGRLYTPEKSPVLGNPFFESSNFQPAILKYRNLDLKCPLQYNIYSGEVLTLWNGKLIELNKENLLEFNFQNHRFIWLKEEQRSALLDMDGFYELLYDGKTPFYAKRRKFIDEKVEGYYVKKTYVEQDRYFLYRQGALITIKNKSSLLEVLADKKKILKEKIKSDHLDFKKNWEESVQLICRYYDEQ